MRPATRRAELAAQAVEAAPVVRETRPGRAAAVAVAASEDAVGESGV